MQYFRACDGRRVRRRRETEEEIKHRRTVFAAGIMTEILSAIAFVMAAGLIW